MTSATDHYLMSRNGDGITTLARHALYPISAQAAAPEPPPFDIGQASHVDEELIMAAGNAVASVARRITLRGVLITSAALLLAALATAEGIVSWHGQYGFIFAIKHQQIPAALEALGPDCGAVIFALLGVALALLGRRAITERALVCACSALSIVMNLGAADLGSPRAIGAYVMPPVLFAITSDRLIATVRLAAIGRDESRSAWTALARIPLWVLRLIFAPVSTVKGARLALLNATPLPEADSPQADTPAPLPAATRPALPAGETRPAITRPRERGRNGRTYGGKPTKTTRFMAAVAQAHGPIAAIPVDQVARIAAQVCADTAATIGMDAGNARTVLRKAVLAAQNGGAHAVS